MVEALQKGDEVVTAGGVLGRITKLGDSYVSVEIARTASRSRCSAPPSRTVLPKGTLKVTSMARVRTSLTVSDAQEPMNRYPLWKYAIIAHRAGRRLLYTLPNFFGEVAGGAGVARQGDGQGRHRAARRASRSAAEGRASPIAGVVQLDATRRQGALRRHRHAAQGQGRARAGAEPDPDDPTYIVALNLLSRSPHWLTAHRTRCRCTSASTCAAACTSCCRST